MPHQQVARRLHDAATLVRIDAIDGGAQSAAAARANFHDHEMSIIAAYEVELAEAAAVASLENRKPVLLEVIGGSRLPDAAARQVHSTPADEAA
jgi:uncharacterized membrane protein